MIRRTLLLTPLVAGPALAAPASAPAAGERVAIRAGTIHVVEDGEVLTGGATLLVEDGRIVRVGTDVPVPPDAQLVDYGPEAVLVPGLVATDSYFVEKDASPRAADPTLRAIDGFDFYAEFPVALSKGVTAAYLPPADGRLLAGQGAVVKLAGDDAARRVLAAPAALHGSIAADARNTPTFWEPPIPATVDVGIPAPLSQLPRSTMGAIVGLREIVAIAESGEDDERWGPGLAAALQPFLEARVPWRLTARDDDELRALLALREELDLPLVIHGADRAAGLAEELARAGVPVIVESPYRPNAASRDLGADDDAEWPRADTAAVLDRAGVSVALAAPGLDVLFAARLAARAGLDDQAALSAVTLVPARAYGVDGRIGSLVPGKDADFVVLSGDPLEGGSPRATWVDGRLAWETSTSGGPVVLSVDELHVGDGEVLRPGELLMHDGVLLEVGTRVARPRGVRLVRGRAAMPGVFDAHGHLGLEGSDKGANADFPMRRIVGPGDALDRRVARRGVTSVALAPRGDDSSGVPVLAYKPAADGGARQIVEDLVALRLEWNDQNVYESGDKVRKVLEKGVEYHREWAEYEQALAEWEARPPAPPEAPDDDEDEEDDEEDEDGDDDEKDSKRKKDDDEDDEDAAEGFTGVWLGEVQRAPLAGEHRLRLQLLDEDGPVRGRLRCDALSETLVELRGRVEDGALKASGRGTEGLLRVEASLDDGRLTGRVLLGEEEVELDLERTASEYPMARRPGPSLDEEEDEPDEPKGKPDEPKLDERLEPVRRAIDGEATLLIVVEGADEILECVETCREAGVRPVLVGADGATEVADEIAAHVTGVLPSARVVRQDRDEGARLRNVYAELQSAGLRVGFRSDAEAGAAELMLRAAYAASEGMSAEGALRALTSDVAEMYGVEDRVGRLAEGLDADVLLLDGSPLELGCQVLRVWVNGEEVL